MEKTLKSEGNKACGEVSLGLALCTFASKNPTPPSLPSPLQWHVALLCTRSLVGQSSSTNSGAVPFEEHP